MKQFPWVGLSLVTAFVGGLELYAWYERVRMERLCANRGGSLDAVLDCGFPLAWTVFAQYAFLMLGFMMICATIGLWLEQQPTK